MIRLAGFDKRGVQSGDQRLHGDVDCHREPDAHAVISVPTRRTHRLPMLYLRGIFTGMTNA
jgi:hypothetical protein